MTEDEISKKAKEIASELYDPETEEILSDHYVYHLQYLDSGGMMSVGIFKQYPSEKYLSWIIETYLLDYTEITNPEECGFELNRVKTIDNWLDFRHYDKPDFQKTAELDR